MWDWLPSDILYMETTVQLIHCPTASNDHTAGKYKDRHTQCDQTHNTITGNSKMMQNIWNDAEHDEQQLHRNITLPISAIYDHQNNYRRIDQNKSRRQHIDLPTIRKIPSKSRSVRRQQRPAASASVS